MNDEKGERWQTKTTSLKQGIAHIYDTKEFSDVKFLVGGKYPFKAHKLVLAARSSEFARILLSPNAPDEIIIDEKTVTKKGFEILLRFIYKDILGTNDKQSIIEGYLSALYYRQKALQIICEEEIESWIINANEVCSLLDAGNDIPLLKNKCISFIKNHTMDVILSPSFENITFKSLCKILENGALDNVPVLQRIKSIMKWGAKRHTGPINYTLVRQQLLDGADPPLLGKLEFEKLSPEELSKVVGCYKGLLTPEEIMGFMMYFANKDVSVLPTWHSARLEKNP